MYVMKLESKHKQSNESNGGSRKFIDEGFISDVEIEGLVVIWEKRKKIEK